MIKIPAALTAAALVMMPSISSAQETSYPVTIQNGPTTLVFEAAPERTLVSHAARIELMLALGLGDRILGTMYQRNDVLPEFAEQEAALPQIAGRNEYPSFEMVVEASPDFIYSEIGAFRDELMAPVDRMLAMGINPYITPENFVLGPTMEDVYQDILELGIIFNVQPRADEIIGGMQDEIAAVQQIVGEVTPVRVFVLDAGTDDAFTAGLNLETEIIALAGGVNVFDDLDQRWATVSWEEVVERSPEVIIVNNYGATPAEEKVSILRNSAGLSSIPAIQNDRIIVMDLTEFIPGLRPARAVRTLAEHFYPELFAEQD